MSDEYLLKVCITGSTDLKNDFTRTFSDWITPVPEVGFMVITKQIQVDGNTVKLILVAKQEDTDFRPRSYYRGSSAAIITFDKSSWDSFNAVQNWFDELWEFIPKLSIPLALVGFLTDSEVVTKEEGQQFAEELDAHYFEIQPTNEEAIKEIFHELVLLVLKK